MHAHKVVVVIEVNVCDGERLSTTTKRVVEAINATFPQAVSVTAVTSDCLIPIVV